MSIVSHHIELIIIGGHLIHFSDVLRLSLIHIGEIVENVSFYFFFVEDTKHLERRLSIKSIAIFAFDDFFTVSVIKSCKMFVIDIFDINPFDFEVAFELKGMILPPEGKSLLVITRFKASYSFKHPALDCTKEEIGIGILG